MPDSVRPHGQQPTRLFHPQDSPGKNTGVGCHFLLHPEGLVIKNPPANAGRVGSIPGLGRLHMLLQAHVPQLLSLCALESVLHKRSHRNKKPSTATREQPLLPQREKMVNSNKDLLPPKKRYTHGNRRDERGEVHPYDQVKAEEAGRERLHVRTLEREQQVTQGSRHRTSSQSQRKNVVDRACIPIMLSMLPLLLANGMLCYS